MCVYLTKLGSSNILFLHLHRKLKGTVSQDFRHFLKKLYLNPIWPGKHGFVKFFVFLKIFEKNVCVHSNVKEIFSRSLIFNILPPGFFLENEIFKKFNFHILTYSMWTANKLEMLRLKNQSTLMYKSQFIWFVWYDYYVVLHMNIWHIKS